MQPDAFNQLPGPDGTHDSAETERAPESATPHSRTKLARSLVVPYPAM
jgi:hypothetical protein